ncbi:MAG: DsrE family protein [Planctomycetes bacterium]|nr:DsrE family protein [Planctomycetota bacterium]
MKLAIVLSTNDPETTFNALRLGCFAAGAGDTAGIFLMGKGVELDRIQDEKFDVRAQAEAFLDAGGEILACGTCLKIRDSSGSELCPLSTMKDLYDLIRAADRVVSF